MTTMPTGQRVLLSAMLAIGVSAPAFAQGVQPVPASPAARQTKAKANWTLKHHLSLQVSGGFDLDVFGSILAVGVGTRETPEFTQTLVINKTAYPDAYVATPRRSEAAIGFGIFSRDELFARVSRATYLAQPIGVGVEQAKMTAALSPYKETSLEFGLRHYFNTGSTRRTYVAISGGQRNIRAISGVFTPDFGDSLGTLRLYDASKVTTMSLEFGTTVEYKHIGVYLEGGARYQGRLTRNDSDLAVWKLETANNTVGRLYMPVQFGFILRL
jgi:hypothetical protein